MNIRYYLFASALFVQSLPAYGTERFATVDYLGVRIPLARAYHDFDEYKDDPHNLPQQSIRRVESIMRSAPFASDFADTDALSHELERIQFPGYATFYANQLGAKLDPSLELVYVEIPGGKLNRYFAIERVSGGGLRVIADFVAPAVPEITRVHRKNGALSFESSQGKVISTQFGKTR
ncbi:hypothetical protein GJ699_19985 [Duganella sp. FT80W]|uniref:Uncharacterized protein n=1 Tax=Duganella guangzhouensis TaxID=2666084 RepID=A0A6I2L7K6_9BURK|nr:hypothetical protein [Duganella guangzhouensis]MRW92279.1 hypothetical protein [Duganella guangzhouensis]